MTVDINEAAKRSCRALGHDPDEVITITGDEEVPFIVGDFTGNAGGYGIQFTKKTYRWAIYVRPAREAHLRSIADRVIREMAEGG